MVKDTQSRKWQLTVNNPLNHGYTHDWIIGEISYMSSVCYYCLADEIGEEGTYHTHIFLYAKSAIRFSTIRNRFGFAHIEMAKGTCKENRDYITKTGKWEKDKKHETCVEGTFEEFGEMPVERQGSRTDYDTLYDLISQGMSDFDILQQDSGYMKHLDMIGRTRQVILQEKFKSSFRQLETTYIWGASGAGKTRSVLESYGYDKVYRVTDYLHPFDSYCGQDVILFDEFRSDIPLKDMLKYLDGYPLELPSRYINKYACYTKCFIISNIPITSQYPNVYRDEYDSYLAFLRRIHHEHYFHDGIIEKNDLIVDDKNFRRAFIGEVPISWKEG